MSIMGDLPDNVEKHLIEVCKSVLIWVEQKKGRLTTYSRNGILSMAKKALKDFSDQGWPKEKLYQEKIKPYVDDTIKEKQGELLKSRTKKSKITYQDIAPKKDQNIELNEEGDNQEEEPEERKDTTQDERIRKESASKAKAEKIEEMNVIRTKTNQLGILKKKYNEATEKIKNKCMDETKQRHPLIQSIFRCLDHMENFYNAVLDAFDERTDTFEDNAKAAEFFISEIEKEIKRIDKSLQLDPELWIEPEYRSWVIHYHYFLDRVNNLTSAKKEND